MAIYFMINIDREHCCWTGSAADICKAAMLDCDADLRCLGLDAKLLLQIHDELVWEVADPDLQRTARKSQTLNFKYNTLYALRKLTLAYYKLMKGRIDCDSTNSSKRTGSTKF